MKELDDDKSESSNSQITSEEEKDSDDDEDISQDSVDAGELVATLDTIAGQTAGSAANKRRGGFIVNQ